MTGKVKIKNGAWRCVQKTSIGSMARYATFHEGQILCVSHGISRPFSDHPKVSAPFEANVPEQENK